MRENEECGEEELYCSGKVAVHSKGSHTSSILQKSYTCETEIKHALWCKFHTSIPDQFARAKEDEEIKQTRKIVDCICLLDSFTLKAFTANGEDFISSLQFQV